MYGPDQLVAIKNAISEFSKVTDTSATLVSEFIYSSEGVCPLNCSRIEDENLTCLPGYPNCHFVL